MKYFQDYLHHGFYPFFLEQRNFTENLLKTMNMMTEVDILLIKQIELKYLPKIKSLFYQLAAVVPQRNTQQLVNIPLSVKCLHWRQDLWIGYRMCSSGLHWPFKL